MGSFFGLPPGLQEVPGWNFREVRLRAPPLFSPLFSVDNSASDTCIPM